MMKLCKIVCFLGLLIIMACSSRPSHNETYLQGQLDFRIDQVEKLIQEKDQLFWEATALREVIRVMNNSRHGYYSEDAAIEILSSMQPYLKRPIETFFKK